MPIATITCHSEFITVRSNSDLTLVTLALRSVGSSTSRTVHSLFAKDFRGSHEPSFDLR